MTTDLLTAPAVAGSFDFVQIDPDHNVPNIVARLHVKASEVNQLLRERDPQGRTRDKFLYLFADTFVLDVQFAASSFLKIVTRVFDARPLERTGTGAAVLEIPLHPRQKRAAVQLLVQDLLGKDFCIERAGRGGHYYPEASLKAQRTPKVFTWESDAEDSFGDGSVATERVAEVARQPHVWNILKAQFAAACEWLDAPAHRAEGLEALRWVVQCTQALATKPADKLAAEASQLNYQATALLLLAGSAGGPRHVPVWSEDYLKGRIDQLLEVLHGYEEKAASLAIRGDMQQTVAALTKALSEVAAADEAALATAAAHNQQEIDDAWVQYHALSWAYEMQEHTVRVAFLEFQYQLDIKAVIGTVSAVLEIVNLAGQMAAMYFGAAVPDPKAAAKALADAEKEAARLVKMADDVGALVMDAIKTSVIDYVKKLKNTLEKVAKYAKLAAEAAIKASEIRKLNELAASATLAMPALAGMGDFDPVLDWNLYITQVELSLREFMNGTGEKNPPVSGAKEYYLTLYALAEYGKALSSKAVTLMRLQGRALELEAQRNASRFAVQRWQRLEAEAKSAEEKLSLAQSLLAEAGLNTKRSLLVLEEGYRAAYYYNHLTEVPRSLRLGMDYSEMRQAFVNIKRDLTGLFEKPKHTQLTYTRYLELPVVRAGSPRPTQPHAVLTQPPGGAPTLSWSLALLDPALRPWLQPAKLKLFFVKEAWFELLGAKPDADGLIALDVTTTGNYANGYSTQTPPAGSPQPGQFTSAGTSLEFSYDPAQPDKPLTPWCPVEIDKSNYMRPTPFTTWLATITQAGTDLSGLHTLRLKLALHALKLA
jgi:hypothetical protein